MATPTYIRVASDYVFLRAAAPIWHDLDLPITATGYPPAIPTSGLDDIPRYGPRDIDAACILAIVFSSISIITSVISLYWFIRMRRRFRHDLIMTLVITNMFKAFWFLLFPVVQYGVGELITSDSAFCQVSGYFLSLGMEAADVAILLIALHSALGVFKPSPSSDQGGLYPYRYWAFASLFLFPILISSLAFTNPHYAYTAQGSVCYLPSRPLFYYGLLAWLPRYIITLVILIVYPGIYFYVEMKFRRYKRELQGTRTRTHSLTPRFDRSKKTWLYRVPMRKKRREKHEVVELPTRRPEQHITYADERHGSQNHGQTIAPNGPNRRRSNGVGSKTFPTSPRHSQSSRHSRTPSGAFIPDEISMVTGKKKKPRSGSNVSTTSFSTKPTPSTGESYKAPHSESTLRSQPATSESTSEATIEEPTAPRRVRSLHTTSPDVASDHDSNVEPEEDAPDPDYISRVTTLGDSRRSFQEAQTYAQRELMHRQLRYLFIYPLVYILMWLIPFVAHIARYQSGYYRHPSYVLDALTVVSTSSQAAVDCLVFIFVEQPWKHIPGSDGTFLGSFACVRIRERRRRGAGLRWADGEGPMTMQEARNAERRRAERRRKKEEEGNRLRRLKSLQQPAEHYWWEQYGDLESEHGGSTSARDKQSSRQESHRERNDLEQGGNGDTNKAHRDENRAGDEGG